MKLTRVLLITVLVFVFLILILNFCFWTNPASTQTHTDYELKEAFPNLSFNQPVGIYHAGDGTNRLFVVSQQGEIHVFVNSEDVMTSDVFLDIKDHVLSGGEQGLLGLAFHPNFENNGYFYLDYTTDNPRRTVVSRFTLSIDNPNQGDSNSEEIILEVMQPYSNHNGGQIVFGSDGYLYISLGDGGSGGDPLGNGQNRASLLGSILRIDIDTQSEGENYGIPSDNPFVGNTQGFREEIYAFGLRNTWRFSFDSATDWLWAGDVGQSRIEEIDIVEKGKNYGWNIMEGSLCYSPSEGCDTAGLELPLWEYDHNLGNSITGGFVYRGSRLSELNGDYIYSDFGSGRIWALNYNGQDNPVNRELVDTNLNVASLGVDQDDELYICAFDGKIYEIHLNTELLLIGTPVQFPSEPTPDQDVSVTVELTAVNRVQNVILSYGSDTEWTNITMTNVSENMYAADIPAMPNQTQVNYRIIAYDNMNNVAINDNNGIYFSYTVIPEFQSFLIFTILILVVMTVIVICRNNMNAKS